MATPNKKMKTEDGKIQEANGFIHSISPIKQSKTTKYFNAVFQEEGAFTDLVCFNTENHSKLVELEKNKSPICLKNIERIVSRNKPGEFDIKMRYNTQILSPVRQLTFRFEQPAEKKKCTIDEVKQNACQYSKVTVTGKVMDMEEPFQQMLKNGSNLQRRDIIIADTTNDIVLCLWGENCHEVEEDKTYEFQNVTVRIWDEIKSLSTSVESTIITAPNMENVHAPEHRLSSRETITIQTVNCSLSTACSVCNNSLETINQALSTVKCTNCHMRQRTTDITKTLKCELMAKYQDQIVKLTVPDNVLKKSPLTNNCLTPDDMEDALLNKQTIDVDIKKGQVTKIYSL